MQVDNNEDFSSVTIIHKNSKKDRFPKRTFKEDQENKKKKQFHQDDSTKIDDDKLIDQYV
ncbi:MAG: hypothetical protein OEV44_15165 [Spirochaetota bacterium]|nr:hypothetical protein [Spirochaetota bacterium]